MTNKTYRCYFTEAGDRIRTYEQIECVCDSAAALKVDELLSASQYSSAELWEGKRLVGRWNVRRYDQTQEARGGTLQLPSNGQFAGNL